jgi:hypothetical protein
MANVFKVYRDSEVTTDRIRAEAAAQSIAQPSRVVNVFSGASNVAPNFDTFAGALTYANSLDPSTAEPVSIRMFAKADGTPYEITGADDWYALCLDGIYVSSPFREIFSTTTLPTTLPKGMRVMYVDGNGVETLWVGNADGEAWPSVGYKEVILAFRASGDLVDVVAKKNDIGYSFPLSISVVFYNALLVPSNQIQNYNSNKIQKTTISYINTEDEFVEVAEIVGSETGVLFSFISAVLFGRATVSNGIETSIRIYP